MTPAAAVPQLTSGEVKELVVAALTNKAGMEPRRRQIMVVGGPGTAKTATVEAGARIANHRTLVGNPGAEDPTVPGGMPWFEKGAASAEFFPFGIIAAALAATEPTVLLLDDLPHATHATQAAYLPWLWARSLHGRRLPDCVTIMATGNDRHHKAASHGLIEPVRTRFATTVELVPSAEEWVRWAISAGITPWLVAWIDNRPEMFYRPNWTGGMANYPSPRTLEHADSVLKFGIDGSLLARSLAGAIGHEAANDALTFRKLVEANAYATLENIFSDPETALIPSNPGTLYAIVAAAGERADRQTFDAVVRYAERLHGAGHGEFATLLIADATRGEREYLRSTSTYVRVVTGPLGAHFTGATR
jgi:hypothetical protein